MQRRDQESRRAAQAANAEKEIRRQEEQIRRQEEQRVADARRRVEERERRRQAERDAAAAEERRREMALRFNDMKKVIEQHARESELRSRLQEDPKNADLRDSSTQRSLVHVAAAAGNSLAVQAIAELSPFLLQSRDCEVRAPASRSTQSRVDCSQLMLCCCMTFLYAGACHYRGVHHYTTLRIRAAKM